MSRIPELFAPKRQVTHFRTAPPIPLDQEQKQQEDSEANSTETSTEESNTSSTSGAEPKSDSVNEDL